MEVALIPPVSLLEDTNLTWTQLMLPHMMSNKKYSETYRKHIADVNKWVIMDNGAAEGEYVTDEALFHYAMEWLPDEMALPDVLGNRTESVDRAIAFHQEFGSAMFDAGVHMGYVVTGFDVEDAYNGLLEVMRANVDLRVLYLPRLLVKKDHKKARIDLAAMIHRDFEHQFDIHFFGASPLWCREVVFASEIEYIRSIDTSLPYNFAFHNRNIESGIYTSRPEHYFEYPASEFPNVDIQVKRYLKWAL